MVALLFKNFRLHQDVAFLFSLKLTFFIPLRTKAAFSVVSGPDLKIAGSPFNRDLYLTAGNLSVNFGGA